MTSVSFPKTPCLFSQLAIRLIVILIYTHTHTLIIYHFPYLQSYTEYLEIMLQCRTYYILIDSLNELYDM